MDGLGAVQSRAGDAPCVQERPAQLCKGAGSAHWSLTAAERALPPFSLAAEGSTGAEVGRMGSSVLTVQTPQPALTAALSVSGNPSALLLGGGCSSGAL